MAVYTTLIIIHHESYGSHKECRVRDPQLHFELECWLYALTGRLTKYFDGYRTKASAGTVVLKIVSVSFDSYELYWSTPRLSQSRPFCFLWWSSRL